VEYLAGLIHHNDAGSQYTSIAFTDRLTEAGIEPSIGSVVATRSTTPSPRSSSDCSKQS
jgi:transposase InsO family protein